MIEENLLHQFASYNCIWTLSCLTTDELAVPAETYRRNGPTNIICRSGGSGQNKVTTFYEDAIGGKLEFFIDDINIESLISPNLKSRTSNANFISFNILEPYSMGLFMQTLQIASTASGYQNYITAPFMLSVEFVGFDDDGDVLVTETGEYLRRDFPIKLTNIEFDVTTEGTNYNVEAMPWNEQAFADDIQDLNSEISIKGSTIVELLQTGEQSLTTIINGRLEELRQINNLAEADEVIITFPNDVATKENPASTLGAANGTGATKPSKKRSLLGNVVSGAIGGVIGGALNGNKNVGQAALGGAIGGALGGGGIGSVLGGALGGALTNFKTGNTQGLFQNISGFLGAQAPQNFESFLSMITGQILTKSNIGANLSRIAQDASTVNTLGKAKIIQSFTEAGQAPYVQTGQVYDKKNKVMTRAKNVISNDERVFQFPAGTKTTRVIEKVILSSQWAKQLKERSPDQNGMIEWFRIDAETYLKPNADQENVFGENAKVYHYKVVPYLVHHSHLQSSQQAGLNYSQLKENAKKEYNYIYTGKNNEILSFDIRFNGAFRQFIQSDAGQGSLDAKTGSTQNNTVTEDTEQLKLDIENSGTISATGASVQTFTNTSSSMGNGGAGLDNSKLRWARQFQDNILGSGSIDLVEVQLEIVGDPYFIFDSGLGNYSANASELNITEDGTMEYQRSECDIVLNFRTPLDYDEDKQTTLFPDDTTLVGMFSGLYRVVEVTNTFSNNQFRQVLRLLRRRGQPEDTGTTASNRIKVIDAPKTQVIATPFKD